jgi:hypothetical protein
MRCRCKPRGRNLSCKRCLAAAPISKILLFVYRGICGGRPLCRIGIEPHEGFGVSRRSHSLRNSSSASAMSVRRFQRCTFAGCNRSRRPRPPTPLRSRAGSCDLRADHERKTEVTRLLHLFVPTPYGQLTLTRLNVDGRSDSFSDTGTNERPAQAGSTPQTMSLSKSIPENERLATGPNRIGERPNRIGERLNRIGERPNRVGERLNRKGR